MVDGVNESRFYMWRGVVAMAHADGVVTPHELSFINDYVKDINFTQEQLDIIGQDLHEEKSVQSMFSQIEDVQDKKDFFALARAISWCDGDYDAQEKLIIEQLEKSAVAENFSILQKSRDVLNEIDLCQNQWKFGVDGGDSIFGFVAGLRTKTT